MPKQHLNQNLMVLAHFGRVFTGYDWTGLNTAAYRSPSAAYALDPAADATISRRQWRARAEAARHVVKPRRNADSLRQRVGSWAHARVPGDPCIGQGC